eukprot:2622017-Rhodomonas_salina.2
MERVQSDTQNVSVHTCMCKRESDTEREDVSKVELDRNVKEQRIQRGKGKGSAVTEWRGNSLENFPRQDNQKGFREERGKGVL